MEIHKAIESFKADPKSSAFVLDFDGSLSPIVEHPSMSRAEDGAVEVLEALASRYLSVVVLSGRTSSDLLRMLGAMHSVTYLGVYGAEEVSRGQITQPPEAETWRGMASRLARDAEAFIATEGLQGCWAEYKDIAVSVHYRAAADPAAGDSILAWASQAASRRGFIAEPGRKVVEMRPLGVSKAEALKRLVRRVPVNNIFIAGDDVADADAMALAPTLATQVCLAVGVGSDEAPLALREAADLMVAGPEELIQLLTRFV